MSALEQDLRATLAAVAEEAPSDLGLLSRVSSRALHRSRVRSIAAATAVAGGVAAAVVAMSLHGGRSSTLDYAHDPGSFFVAGPGPVSFPLTPGYLPPGIEAQPAVLERTPAGSSLTYWPQDGGVQGNLQVVVSASRPGVEPQRQSTTRPTTHTGVSVHGRPGVLSCDLAAITCRLTYQQGDGHWVRVDRAGDRAATVAGETIAVADGLRDAPLQPTGQLRVGKAPRGCSVSRATALSIELSGRPDCRVRAAVVAALRYPGTATRYGGRRALVQPSSDPSLRSLIVEENADWSVAVAVPRSWDRPLVDAFVAALAVPA